MRTDVKGITKLIATMALVPCMALYACTGTDGTDGTNGTDGVAGTSCTVADNADGTKTITCEDSTTATVTDGTSCTVADNADGTKTITCDDGTTATVADGQGVDPGTIDNLQNQIDQINQVGAEACAVCHADSGAQHQEVYDNYADASTLVLTIVGVSSTDMGGTWDATMTFTITKNGMPFVDADGLPQLDQKRFYTMKWTGSQYLDSVSFGDIMATDTPGEYTATASGLDYAPEQTDATAYGYIADEKLPIEPSSGHVTLYNDVSNAGKVFGNAGDYASAATVQGCEKCHGAPYMKHGYRAAAVPGLPDFVGCKSCHYDNRQGGHLDWQMLVDDPARYAEIFNGADLTAAEQTKYAYTANVMNDVHMSHAMEFPYPQSMANCATCHEGKLDMVLTDENFTAETCKSCHPVTGSEAYGTAGRALETIWANAGVDGFHGIEMDCNSCHMDGGSAPTFAQIHTGYDKKIYADAVGTKYSQLVTATVDSATLSGSTLTVGFSIHEDASSTLAANPADVVPTLSIGLYG